MAKSEIDKNLVIKIGAFTVGYFVIVKPLLQWLGLKQDKADKENTEVLRNNQSFDPNFWLKMKAKYKDSPTILSTKFLNLAKATAAAQTIYDSWGTALNPNDNEEQIYAVFRVINTRTKLSQVSYVYRIKYGQDLGYTLQSRLSDSEFNNIAAMVSKYPLI